MDIHFTPQLREVMLHAGELQLNSSKQGSLHHAPLQGRVREGVVRAIGTRFTVKQHSHYGLARLICWCKKAGNALLDGD